MGCIMKGEHIGSGALGTVAGEGSLESSAQARTCREEGGLSVGQLFTVVDARWLCGFQLIA